MTSENSRPPPSPPEDPPSLTEAPVVAPAVLLGLDPVFVGFGPEPGELTFRLRRLEGNILLAVAPGDVSDLVTLYGTWRLQHFETP